MQGGDRGCRGLGTLRSNYLSDAGEGVGSAFM